MTSTMPASIQDAAVEILECGVCLQTMCEPITISCGHSFCRVCLVKALRRSNKKCPTCRAVCHIQGESAQETLALSMLCRLLLSPHEYAKRAAENDEEKGRWARTLPIFFFNRGMVPGERLALNLFEPRYRTMMKRIVNSGRRFAYLPNYSQYTATVGDIGLIAELCEAEERANGCWLMEAKLIERFKVDSTWIEAGTGDLHFCEVIPFTDLPANDSLSREAVESLERCEHFLAEIPGLAREQLFGQYGQIPPASRPVDLSFWLCFLLNDTDTNIALRERDTSARFAMFNASLTAIMHSRGQLNVNLGEYELDMSDELDMDEHRIVSEGEERSSDGEVSLSDGVDGDPFNNEVADLL